MGEALRFQGFSENTFKFFFELGLNNMKSWFDAHRDEYDRYVLTPLKAMVVELGARLREMDPGLEEPKTPARAIARINRDIRFSKDKSPYRTNLWITFKRPTPDWKFDPVFYFEVAFGKYAYGMGYYEFPPETREGMKAVIRTDRPSFDTAVAAVAGSSFRIGGDRYKRPIDKSLSDLERQWCERKSLYVFCEKQADGTLFKPELIDTLYKEYLSIKPVYDFFWKIKGGQ